MVWEDRFNPRRECATVDMDDRWLAYRDAAYGVRGKIRQRVPRLDPHIGRCFILRDASREHPPDPRREQDPGCQEPQLRGAEIVSVERPEGP